MTEETTDAIGVLRWGLRRYWLVLFACMVLGVALAPLYMQKVTAPNTDSSALIVAQRLQLNLVTLPRYGEAVFDNGQIAQAVAAKYGGSLQDVVPTRVSLVANQDSIVFQVVGHDSNPRTSAAIANTAAAVFLKGLNAGGADVGAFVLQSAAQPPSTDSSPLGAAAVRGIGLIAGLALGLALLTMLLAVRRPVIDPADAEEATGVASLGSVTIPRGSSAPLDRWTGLAPVCRRLLQLPTSTVILVSRRRDGTLRRRLAVALAETLGQVRDVRFVGSPTMRATVPDRDLVVAGRRGSNGNGLPPAAAPSMTVLDSSQTLDLVQSPARSAAVLVVRRGISGSALRAAAVEHLGGSAEARILLVRRGGWARRGASADAVAAGGAAQPLPLEVLAEG